MQVAGKKQNGIVEGVIYKQLLLFFFPILLGTFFQQLYAMVDAAIVGNFVGKEALAAGILRAIGDAKRPLYYLIAASIVNVLLDLLFVGVFYWGIQGAAAATVVAQICNMILVFWYLHNTTEDYGIRWNRVRFQLDELKKMLRLGVPTGMQGVLYAVSNIIIQAGII